MKEVFVNNSINLIKKQYNYDNDMLDRVQYGLEIIYISVTKLSVIFITAFILGVIKETLLFTLFVTGLRTFAYGIHAKKSWHCYVSSLLIFVAMPYVFTTIEINTEQKIIICGLSLISMALFAPADTHKRPLVNTKKRRQLKITSFLMCIIYTLLTFVLQEKNVNNIILLAMITQSFAINPMIYKIFKMPYDNYKVYKKNGV